MNTVLAAAETGIRFPNQESTIFIIIALVLGYFVYQRNTILGGIIAVGGALLALTKDKAEAAMSSEPIIDARPIDYASPGMILLYAASALAAWLIFDYLRHRRSRLSHAPFCDPGERE